MRQLKLDWSMVNQVSIEKKGRLEALMRKYDELFKPAMGAIQGFKAKLTVKADAHPSSAKPDLYHFQSSNVLERNLISWRRKELWKE